MIIKDSYLYYTGFKRLAGDIYNKRTSVERTFSRLKEHLNLKNLTVRGAKKAKTHVLLSCISLLAGKITLKKQEERSKITAAA